LQFTPIEYRQTILQRVYDSLLPGGAFVLVEKVLGDSSEIDTMMVDLYYKLKAENGYNKEQIERKRLSLEGVLVPVTASWNIELLRSAGFRKVDCFWRWMNFAGWVAIK
jgi:tRNA (cmo5U34)-methyltransferase